MVFTQHVCAHCGSEQIYRNGSSDGHVKYKCKACLRQGYFEPAAPRKALLLAQVDRLLLERNSQRSIARVTGIARIDDCQTAKKKP